MGETNPHDGVIATRPATTPEAAPNVVGRPSRMALDGDPAQHAEASCDQGVEEDDGRLSIRGERRTRVETEPSEPQQSHTEQNERQVVRRIASDLNPIRHSDANGRARL